MLIDDHDIIDEYLQKTLQMLAIQYNVIYMPMVKLVTMDHYSIFEMKFVLVEIIRLNQQLENSAMDDKIVLQAVNVHHDLFHDQGEPVWNHDQVAVME